MKKYPVLLLIILLMSAVDTFAQATVDTENCLLKEFKQSEINKMSGDELAYQKFVIENAVQVYPVPDGKPKDIYPTKKWIIESDVCVYDLKVKMQADNRTYFFTGNDKLVMIYSEKELKQNYDRNK